MQSVVEGQPDAWTFEREAARAALRSRDPRGFVDALLRDGDIQLAWSTAAAAPQDELGPELRLRLAESCEALSSAGHPPAMVAGRDGIVEAPSAGPLLGAFADADWPEEAQSRRRRRGLPTGSG